MPFGMLLTVFCISYPAGVAEDEFPAEEQAGARRANHWNMAAMTQKKATGAP